MSVEESESTSQIIPPTRALHRKYIEPIIYLADRMAGADGKVVPKERRLVEELAKAANLRDFRRDRWFRNLDEQSACQAIDITLARQAAMVVLSLVLKADADRKESEHAYFTQIRNMIGADPVTVPIEFDAHKELALKYFSQGR